MPDDPIITPEQCRAARAWLGWTREDLARRCRVSHRALHNFETGQTALNPHLREAVRKTFEAAGLRFLFELGEGLVRPKR